MTHRGRTDYVLFAAVIVLIAFGLLMVYSSSSVVAEVTYKEQSYYFLVRQLISAVLAVGALMLLSRRDYRKFHSSQWAFALLGIVLFLLVLVFFVDRRHRWIPLGVTTLQPSELAKPALILFLAWFVRQRQGFINDRRTILSAGMALAVLALTVVIADLGTAAVLVATAGAVFFVAGLRFRIFALAMAVGSVCLAGSIYFWPYRWIRVVNWFSPDTAGDGGYQVRQSLIAIGSGGVTGKGLMESWQKLLYLPEAHTDFIYAIIGEELGLVGCLAVLGAFLLILYRGYSAWWTAADDFGRYIAVGVTTSLVFQALMNMTVVLDLMPTKGITLPLISYGGSSLLA
ncbi:MAG: FtsW/RodA/SpoVE family cell cycle protein, partial [Bryobacteraceae bacterium]